MRFSLLLPLGFAATACAPEVPEDSGDPSNVGEDSGAAGQPASVTLNYDSDATGLGIALVGPWVDSSAAPTEVWLGMDAAGTSQTIDLPAPPDSAIGSLTMLSGGVGAMYYLTVFDDVDGSGTRESGEAWVSVGTFAVYMETLPESAVAAGWTEGWNVVGYPASTLLPLSGVPVTLVRPNYELTLGGTVVGAPADADIGMVLAPQSGTSPAALLHDEALDGDSWSMSVSGPPPADHHVEGSPDLTREQPWAYIDRAPAGYDSRDVGYSGACHGGSAVHLIWAATDDPSMALQLLHYGIGAGWTPTVMGSSFFEPIDVDAYTSLVADGSC